MAHPNVYAMAIHHPKILKPGGGLPRFTCRRKPNLSATSTLRRPKLRTQGKEEEMGDSMSPCPKLKMPLDIWCFRNNFKNENTPISNELVVERNEPTQRHFSEKDLNEETR